MKILFIGIHYRQEFNALDSRTKTGQVVDRIISLLPKEFEYKKCNLYPTYDLPIGEVKKEYIDLFYQHYDYDTYPVWVLLGKEVQKALNEGGVCINHPGSLRFGKSEFHYVTESASEIIAFAKETLKPIHISEYLKYGA